MKPKTVMLLAVAVGSGLLAMLGVQQAMTGSQTKSEETIPVLVALKDIEVGEPLTDQNVQFRDMPLSALPEDPVVKAEQYENRSLIFALKQDDIIRTGKLSRPGVVGKSTQIPVGMQVYSIPVDDAQTISGLLSPGDRVDVLVTYSTRERDRPQTKTMKLLEYVAVFATDDRTARESQGAADSKSKTRNVALLLQPEQVAYLALAQSKGKLGLAWRNRGDDTLVNVGAVNSDALEELKGLPDPSDRPWTRYEGEDRRFAESVANAAANPIELPKDNAGNLDSLLNENETAAPAAAIVVPAKPKPTWAMQIYVGTESQTTEFELPEPPEPPKPEPPSASADGGTLWNLFKQAL